MKITNRYVMLPRDIQEARQPGSRKCPIALCLERHSITASVNHRTLLHSPDLPEPLVLTVNEEAQQFLEDFDNGNFVQPAPLRIAIHDRPAPGGTHGALEMSAACSFL